MSYLSEDFDSVSDMGSSPTVQTEGEVDTRNRGLNYLFKASPSFLFDQARDEKHDDWVDYSTC